MTIGFQRPHTPKSTVRPTTKLICVAAGFLEGEGCFNWRKPKLLHHSTTFRISAIQVNREPVDKLQQLFGGNIASKSARGRSQAAFIWSVNGERAFGVALTIFQFLSKRRQQQILKGFATMRRGRGTKDVCSKGHPLNGENLTWEHKSSGIAYRRCRKCACTYWRRWYHKHKTIKK